MEGKRLTDVHEKLVEKGEKAEASTVDDSPTGSTIDSGTENNNEEKGVGTHSYLLEENRMEVDVVPEDQYELLLDFFRSLEQKRDDGRKTKIQKQQKRTERNRERLSSVQIEEKIYRPVQRPFKSDSQLQPLLTSSEDKDFFNSHISMTTDSINCQSKRSPRNWDMYKQEDEIVSDEEGYSPSPSTSKSFFTNDYSAPNIFFGADDICSYSDLDEDFIFNELKAIDKLLAKSTQAIENSYSEDNTGSTSITSEKNLLKKDSSMPMSPTTKAQNSASDILTDLENFLNKETVNDSANAQALSDDVPSSTSPTGPLHSIEEEELYFPVKLTTTRKRQVIAKLSKPTKMVTGITFMKPNIRKPYAGNGNAKAENELNSGKVPCQFCGEYYYLGPGMSSHIRWKHRSLAVQTCPHCSKTFHDYDLFAEHIERCSQKLARSSLRNRR